MLGSYCAGGYSSGFIGEANARWVADNYDFVVVSDVYRVGYMACLLAGVDDDTPRLDELIEVLEGLDDYPVIDESYLSELVADAEHLCVDDFSRLWDVSSEDIWEAVYELQTSFEWEQDYAYYADDEDELKSKALEIQKKKLTDKQTWATHYFAGADHTVEVCGYCTEAEVA